MALKDEMPTLALNEGVWTGRYQIFDADGKLIDEHQSRVICRLPEVGEHAYWQSNSYIWPDGRTISHEIKASYAEGRLHWRNDLAEGWASEHPLETMARSLVLYWRHAADPELYVYELAQLSGDCKKRFRTWQWIRGGDLVRRTTIDEKLITRDWLREDARLANAA